MIKGRNNADYKARQSTTQHRAQSKTPQTLQSIKKDKLQRNRLRKKA